MGKVVAQMQLECMLQAHQSTCIVFNWLLHFALEKTASVSNFALVEQKLLVSR